MVSVNPCTSFVVINEIPKLKVVRIRHTYEGYPQPATT